MSYRTIAVQAEAGPAAVARIRLAAGIALRFEATLIGVGAAATRPLVDLYATGGMTSLAVEEDAEREIADAEHELDRLDRAFHDSLKEFLVKREWRRARCPPGEALRDAAISADILVVGREAGLLRRDIYRQPVIGDLLLSCGRPLIVAPPGLSNLDPKKVLVCWKDTHEARRAIADALPLLHHAEHITVIEVQEKDGEASVPQSARGYLARHGLNASAAIRKRVWPTVEEDLLAVVDDLGAGFVVAGAYGHSRLKEWVLGGVTRAFLQKCPVPVLLSR